MMKFLKALSVILLVVFTAVFVFVPERKLKKIGKESTKQAAREMNVNPTLAKFLIHTKLGRKITYLTIKKELSFDLEEK